MLILRPVGVSSISRLVFLLQTFIGYRLSARDFETEGQRLRPSYLVWPLRDKMPIKLCLIVFVFYVTAHAQTTSDLKRSYGDPTYAYSVSNHIWMTPDYAPDGQVCRMRLYPKHIDPRTDYLSPRLEFDELSAVLIRLLPLDRRGEKEDLFGFTEVGGGSAWTTYGYEKVTIVFAFPFRLESAPGSKPEEVSFPVDEILARLPKKTPPSIDDFLPSKSTKIELVTILWKNRKCLS